MGIIPYSFAWLLFKAAATMLQWSKGEQNQLFVQVFGKIAELNWMWKTALDEFSNQVWTDSHVMVCSLYNYTSK